MVDHRSRRQKLSDLANHPRTPKNEAAAARRALGKIPRSETGYLQAAASVADFEGWFSEETVGRQAFGGTPLTGADIRRASEDIVRTRRLLLCSCRHTQEAHWRAGVIRGIFGEGICSICGCPGYKL